MASIQVGTIRVEVVQDGVMRDEPHNFFVGVPDEIWREEAPPEDDGLLQISVQCLLVQVGERVAVFDTGLGLSESSPETPGVFGKRGQLIPELARLGIRPERVDLVVLSHGHADHLGGNVGLDGQPAFPNARYLIGAGDLRHFTSAETLAEFPFYGEQLRPLIERRQVEPMEGEVEVLPGVRLLPAPGHTPGHQCVALTSGGQHALFVGDLMHQPAQVTHPDWYPVFDWMPSMSVPSRQRVLDRARAEGTLLLTAHFPYPGVGYAR